MTIEEAIFKKIGEEKQWIRGDEFVNVISSMTHQSKKEIKRVIRDMLADKQLRVDVNNVLSSPLLFRKEMDDVQLKRGVIIGNKEGYAFCRVLGEEGPDYFIPAKSLGGAVNKDTVMIRPVSLGQEGKKREAEVVEIVERGNKQIVGTYYEGKGYAVVQPDDDKFGNKILLEKGVSIIGAVSGDKVVVKLLNQPDFAGAYFTGEIVENLGPSESLDAYYYSILRSHDITEVFPQDVLDFADKLHEPTDDMIAKRKDFRKLTTFTIDGADARDFDDAISLTKLPNGNDQLGVHIADVGEYVKTGNVIDKEAFNRATSVYFPAPVRANLAKLPAVIPMLPEVLSNNLCSLMPNRDRLTLSCMMELDKEGNIVEGENTYICESVINSKHRLTYDQVQKVLENDEQESKNLSDIKDTLLLMNKYSELMTQKAKDNGYVDLDISELEFHFDDQGEVEDITPKRQSTSQKLIENFMVSANKTVAKKFKILGLPFVYRVHEVPDEKKMKEAINVITNMYQKTFGEVPKIINGKFLDKIIKVSDDPIVKEAVSTILLRAMPKATYETECKGHFGLSLQYYCHFTSPIRRYPDLTIHRVIKDYSRGRLNGKLLDQTKKFVSESAAQSSLKEIEATKAEREMDSLWSCKYMSNKLGKEFDVIVSSVTERGIYVKIPGKGVEGLIKIEELPDKSYIYSDEYRFLIGSSTKFVIGDKLKVKLQNVNLARREIDFGYIKSLNPEQDYNNFRQQHKKIKGKKVTPKGMYEDEVVVPQVSMHDKNKGKYAYNKKINSKKNKKSSNNKNCGRCR